LGVIPPTYATVDHILGCFAEDHDVARRRLAAFVRDASWRRTIAV